MILHFPRMRRAAALQQGQEVLGRLQALRGYWEGLRGPDGALPRRSDLDPRGFGAALDALFIAETIGPGLLRLRIAGSTLTQMAGLEMKGLPFSTLFRPEARGALARAIAGMQQKPAVVSLALEAGAGIGQAPLSGRALLLPLADSQGEARLVLGFMPVSGAFGRGPRRFALAGIEVEPLDLPAAEGAGVEEERDRAIRPALRPQLRLVE